MQAKKLGGKGKVYDGNTFICDADYQITARESQPGRNGGQLDINGHLSGIRRKTLYGLEGKAFTLHLDDGRRLNIVVQRLSLVDVQNNRCRIHVNSPI